MNGGGGAVGSFAIQLAKLFDLDITAVDSGFKQDFMRSIGADYVIDTSGLQDRLIKTIGSSKNSEQIKAYLLQAKEFINQYRHQKDLDFDYQDDHDFLQALKSGLKKIQMIGQELILGKIFDEMGFGFNQVN